MANFVFSGVSSVQATGRVVLVTKPDSNTIEETPESQPGDRSSLNILPETTSVRVAGQFTAKILSSIKTEDCSLPIWIEVVPVFRTVFVFSLSGSSCFCF